MHGTLFCDFPGFPGFPVLVGTLMHITVDDVNFCDSLEFVYVKYKSCPSTARELPD